MVVGLLLLIGLAGFCRLRRRSTGWAARPSWEGVFLGVGLFVFGFGLSAWGKYLLPQGPFVEDRHPLASTRRPTVEAMTAAIGRPGHDGVPPAGLPGRHPRGGWRA